MAVTSELSGPIGLGHVRDDEAAVRLVFVEQGTDYAALVREALGLSTARFEVRHATRLEAARHEVESGGLDAVLVDWTRDSAAGGPEGGRISIEEASHLATRVPVIVLTGSDDDEPQPEAEDAMLARIADSPLPDEILRAVRRHRRLGCRGRPEPIVLRDPLRACARVFARVRRSLSGR